MAEITEELLKNLGFIQQNPPFIWDLPVGTNYRYIRCIKREEGWYVSFDKSKQAQMVNVNNPTHLLSVIASTAYNKGVADNQDKLQEALGFDRLVDVVIDRMGNDNE